MVNPVYLIDEESKATKLQRVWCSDEKTELQQLLEHDLDLLPGDQMGADEALQWLLIKREMPVVSPASGTENGSIDFLLADQIGIPTLVECKRRNDGRSTRETVGQLLEYAASGKSYWEAAELERCAEVTAKGRDQLTAKIEEIAGKAIGPGEFFRLMENNLRASRLRLIFFVDESWLELCNIVERAQKA